MDRATSSLNTNPNPLSNTIHHYFTDCPQLTISAQNCNSLNVSTECDRQLAKLIAITDLRTDIIFLSDIRLNKGTAQLEKITKIFACNSNRNYKFFFNSTMSKRGVGILIADALNVSVDHEYVDSNENILGLTITVNGTMLKLCAIYGPNHNDKKFYDNLLNFISAAPECPIIIGGDWNTTYSTADIPLNPDIINMNSPPSITRSGWLSSYAGTRT
jgi:exonuclease III